jgi:mycobactin peptide synthetase MbtE
MLTAAREVLAAPGLTAADDLFEAGMTSLLALRLADRLSEVLGRTVRIADIYHAGSLDQLDVDGDDSGEPVTLSSAQKRFWLAEQFLPGAADNVIVLAYELTGPLDAERLGSALAGLVEQHPILRTRYGYHAGEVVPEVMPAGFVLERVDEPEAVTADWWDKPFALDREAPLRARLCRVDTETHLFTLQVHHIAFDGWSERLLMSELSARYQGHPVKTESAPPRATGIDEPEILYWKEILADAPAPFLPGPANPSIETARREVVRHLSATTVEQIHEKARDRRAPALAALIAAAARAFSRVFGVADLCLGAITEGRSGPAEHATMGYFVNPLPIVLRGLEDAQVFDQASSALLAAQRNSRIPFDDLVRLLGPPRGRHPWFQALVALQYEKPSGELAPGTSLRWIAVPPPRTATEFVVEATPQPAGGWELRLSWRADGCDEVTAADIADEVVKTLEGRLT